MSRRNWKRIAAALVVAVAAWLSSGAVQAVALGDKAPAFTLPASIGKQASLAGYPGKTMVLFFFVGAFTNA